MGFAKYLSCALVFFAVVSAAKAQGCADTIVDLRSGGSQLRFTVEIADDEAERAKGLMFRAGLGQFSGMLFVYDSPIVAAFWMKNTYIPLDMLFMDAKGTVTQIVENAEPRTTIPRLGGTGVKFVLEINGGLARKFGIGIGAVMRHPVVEQSVAVWPCRD